MQAGTAIAYTSIPDPGNRWLLHSLPITQAALPATDPGIYPYRQSLFTQASARHNHVTCNHCPAYLCLCPSPPMPRLPCMVAAHDDYCLAGLPPFVVGGAYITRPLIPRAEIYKCHHVCLQR
jgi:hypothetical protein